MPLPASFRADGFTGQLAGRAKPKFKGILIGTEGRANTGKSEFPFSAPGPGIFLACDRQHQPMLDNPNPPEASQRESGQPPDGWIVQPVEVDLAGTVDQKEAIEGFMKYKRDYYYKALANRDARTVVVDGDSDTFEWQLLAEFGRTTQIPQMARVGLNAARRAMIARAVDSGKIVILTNKVKKQFEKQFDAAGNPIPDPQKPGEQLALFNGKYERQGWNDHEYGYGIQLRHVYEEANGKRPARWGIFIMMCKSNRELEGMTLWGAECSVPNLLETVYPHIDLSEWGY